MVRLVGDCFALNKVVCTFCVGLVLLLLTVANLGLEVARAGATNQTAADSGGGGGRRGKWLKLLAGEHTATWTGYLEGAIESGGTVAATLLTTG